MANGKELGADNVRRFVAWMAVKSNDDYLQMVRSGVINRRDIIQETGISRSVFSQNPEVRRLLHSLEERLRAEGVLPPRAETGAQLKWKSTGRKTDMDQERLPRLETENALLRAELDVYKSRLAQYEILSEILEETGRIPR